MRLLCLADREPTEALPALGLLQHELRTSPLALQVPETLLERFDAILIDGSQDPRCARASCLSLAHASVPRAVILQESALTALTSEWGITELFLPGASPAEVESRLRLLRAANDSLDEDPNSELNTAGIVIEESNFTAYAHGRLLDLTYKEFELLHFLVAHPSRVFTREQLLSSVWGADYFGGARTVDVHVRRLRAKLGEYEGLISTVRGVGYGFARERDQRES